jgi:hypothetical protein
MCDLAEETIKQGTLGLSTGLLYAPANFADKEEVIEFDKIRPAVRRRLYHAHT